MRLRGRTGRRHGSSHLGRPWSRLPQFLAVKWQASDYLGLGQIQPPADCPGPGKTARPENPGPEFALLPLPSGPAPESKRYYDLWEFVVQMNRIAGCFAVVLLSLSAIAQGSDGPSTVSSASPVTSTASTEVGQFQKIEDAWSNAVNMRDQYGLELVLSPLFVDVSAIGNITTRNQQVADLLDNEDKTIHLEQKVVTVRMLGDIAVANGTYLLHHKAATGQVDEKGVFTHVFERAHSGWLCINSQRTSLRADSTTKPKKQSSAEMPFHIPLFSKSEKQSQ
jgi:ketosteroid isomerase-like protein